MVDGNMFINIDLKKYIIYNSYITDEPNENTFYCYVVFDSL